jgi:hypothetical protein
MFPPGLYCRLFIVGDLLSEFLADEAMLSPAASWSIRPWRCVKPAIAGVRFN